MPTIAVDIDLIAVGQAVRVRRDHARIGLRDAGDRLDRRIQNLRTVAVDAHHLVAELKDVGVAGLELKRDQPRSLGAVLDLSQELSARTPRDATLRHHQQVGHVGQAFAIGVQRDPPLHPGRDLTCSKRAKCRC
jgi:hypothetical protein